MRLFQFLAFLIVVAGLFSTSAAQHTIPLDLDATDGFNAVGLVLDAGLYNVSLRAGIFRAWSAWSDTDTGCTNNCARGWLNFYAVFNHQNGQGFYVENGVGTPLDQYDFNSRLAYSTEGAALAAGVLPFAFELDSPALVEIAIPDCDGCFGDNRGGLSLTVSRVFGTVPTDPILPTQIDDDDSFVFNDVPSRRWFDPPLVGAYRFVTTGGSLFTEVGMPPLDVVADADGMYLVTSLLGAQPIAAGAKLVFASPVDSFTVSGIAPLVDGADASAFPTYLVFDHPTASFSMTPIPEPRTLLLGALASVGLLLRRQKQ